MRIGLEPVLGANSSTLTFKNLNLAALDLDGDATVNLLHMPQVKTYSIYTPLLRSAGWRWVGRAVTTASGLSPKIDFGKDTLDTQIMDVNFDGLVDVVVTTGTQVQTFLSLGRYPSGDGQFGHATRTGIETSSISNNPITACVPWAGNPVRFSDSDTKLADMNGDGIPDIVRVRRGDIYYWPGRGNGFWGTGKRDDCPAGTFGSGREIRMHTSPYYSDIQGDSLRLDDVNGDGLADLVQVRYDAVDIWLNVDGKGWTQRHIIDGTPPTPSYANRVRLTDINGSGTSDILWGNGRNYQYIDLYGGVPPRILVRVENGLGKTTDIEYSTSTAEMLAAEKLGACPKTGPPEGSPWSVGWCSKMLTVAHVVKRVTESDNITVAGRSPGKYITEYEYRDPVFEGRQREFRGFKHARARKIGDANSPTSISESTFLLGECKDETVGARNNGVNDCAVEERWRDNPREALKGLPVVTETYDEAGTYLSTSHTRYRLRTLYTGLDGRVVRHAFQNGSTQLVYDTGPFTKGESSIVNHSVELEHGTLFDAQDTSTTIVRRSSSGTETITSGARVDTFGNKIVAISCGRSSTVPTVNPGTAQDVHNCAGSDEVISQFTIPGRPAGDVTSWLWRTVESWVEGSEHTQRRGHSVITYNAQGDPVRTDATLEGSVPLLRSHSGGGAVAPTPGGASTDQLIFVSSQTYDSFGNVTRSQAANNRCADVSYESAYAHLPRSETIYTDGCGAGALTTKVEEYDRG